MYFCYKCSINLDFFYRCDWTFVGHVEAGNSRVMQFRAEMSEANIFHSLERPELE